MRRPENQTKKFRDVLEPRKERQYHSSSQIVDQEFSEEVFFLKINDQRLPNFALDDREEEILIRTSFSHFSQVLTISLNFDESSPDLFVEF